jgi:hypothetical protein
MVTVGNELEGHCRGIFMAVLNLHPCEQTEETLKSSLSIACKRVVIFLEKIGSGTQRVTQYSACEGAC